MTYGAAVASYLSSGQVTLSLISTALFTATGCTVTVDNVEARCNTTAGVGANLFWQIQIRGQSSPLSGACPALLRPCLSVS